MAANDLCVFSRVNEGRAISHLTSQYVLQNDLGDAFHSAQQVSVSPNYHADGGMIFKVLPGSSQFQFVAACSSLRPRSHLL